MRWFTGWSDCLAQLREELKQRMDEGFRIPEMVRWRCEELIAAGNPVDDAELDEIYTRLAAAPRDAAFRYVEPDDWMAIQSEWPLGPKVPAGPASTDAELLDRMHGAWTGRAVGCALGKPVEIMGMEPKGRAAIKKYLLAGGDWPLVDYFRGGPEIWNCASCREVIAYMEPDDDIHYTLIALKVLEKYGRDFHWYDIANTWNDSLPYNAICTAETQAIMNYNLLTPRLKAFREPPKCTPEFTSSHNNPYREWIGAQIRADFWGYCSPGKPFQAAEFAWRDAHWTHRRNGIYGAMFIAAVTAAAFRTADWRELIELGLAVVPARSRLAEGIRWAMEELPGCRDFEAFMDKLDARYAGMSPVHTINNCLIVIMALYFGLPSPDRTAALAVMGGLDTDCNGATAGSIAGLIAGRAGFGGVLAERLRDQVKPLVFGFQDTTFAELARRTLAVTRRINC